MKEEIMNQTNIKIGQLRDRMKELGIDAYLVPTADFHESEYVGEFFKCRHFLTGFNGTAGTAVITMDKAGLWTDSSGFKDRSTPVDRRKILCTGRRAAFRQ